MAGRKVFRGKKRVGTIAPGSNGGDEHDANRTNGDGGEPERDIDASERTAGIEDSSGTATFDPASARTFEPDSDTEQPRKRGRKPGTKNKKQNEVHPALGEILYDAHLMLSAWAQTPELELSPEESEKLGGAINRVQSFYKEIEMPAKALAWIHLGFAVGKVYGPRYAAIRIRNTREKQRKPQVINVPITKNNA